MPPTCMSRPKGKLTCRSCTLNYPLISGPHDHVRGAQLHCTSQSRYSFPALSENVSLNLSLAMPPLLDDLSLHVAMYVDIADKPIFSFRAFGTQDNGRITT